ncbi:DUF4129 domain-containing protein, partial [Vulcaniibacterium tengchongense]
AAQERAPAPAPRAAPAADAGADARHTPLATVFGGRLADDRSLREAVRRAYADPSVSPKRTVHVWKKKHPDAPKAHKPASAPLRALGALVAAVGEYGLWLLFAALVLALLLTAKRWLPWLRDGVARERREPGEIRHQALDAAAPLPDDVAGAARRLWREGREREALALAYRASVAAMARRAQWVPVPGATEAECLRAARRLPQAEDRDLFARAVRVWQYAAYAQRLPGAEEFEALLAALARRFWQAPAADAAERPA